LTKRVEYYNVKELYAKNVIVYVEIFVKKKDIAKK